MKTKTIFIRSCLISFILVLALSVLPINGFSAPVDENEAIAIADLWYAMELNSKHIKIDEAARAERFAKLGKRKVMYLVSKDELLDSHPVEGEVLAYIVKYDPAGFVIVMGDDRLEPILVFDVESQFRWDEPERNFLRYFTVKETEKRWGYLKDKVERGEMVDVHSNWKKLRIKLDKKEKLEEVIFNFSEAPGSPDILVLWDTALWDQMWPYNTVCVANNGNNNVPTGCTATAMAIKMRFHSWPSGGSGSHGYNDTWGSIQFSHFVNFGNQTYNWANMPTGSLTQANADVANLMYHCGVAVDMNYELGGSGAWPTASSMNTYFGYKGTEDRGGGDHIRDSIIGGLPVVIASTAHTFVGDGYRDTLSPYYHLNCGWSGSNNGWYNLNSMPGGDPTIDYSSPYCSPSNYIYVDAGWSGDENGNIQNPYNTLSEGNTAVPNSGHLWVKAGSYTGSGNVPITFNKQMTIRSYWGTAVIGGP